MEYDQSPTRRRGVSDSARDAFGGRPGVVIPARRTSTAPRTGNSAAVPGIGVRSSKASAATPISNNPVTAEASRIARGHLRTNADPTSATSAPAPSSQARAGVEKYAVWGEPSVDRTDHIRLVAVRTTSSTARAGRDSPGRR